MNRCRKRLLSIVVWLVRTSKRLYPLANVVRYCSGDWYARPAAGARQASTYGRSRGPKRKWKQGRKPQRPDVLAVGGSQQRVAGARHAGWICGNMALLACRGLVGSRRSLTSGHCYGTVTSAGRRRPLAHWDANPAVSVYDGTSVDDLAAV